MTATSHTPGPWNATANGVHRGTACVALTHMEPREQRLADAKLIAAAPEMAEILRELIQEHGAALPVQLAGRAYGVLAKAGLA